MQQLNPIVSRLLGLSPEVSYEAVDNVKEGTVANNLNVPQQSGCMSENLVKMQNLMMTHLERN